MVEMERAGLPTVSFTAAGFVKDARRSAQAFGLTALPIAVVPLPLTNQTPEEVRRAVDGCIDQVIQGLTESPATIVEAPAASPIAERLTVVIDKHGVIQYVTHNAVAQGRDHKEALAALA